eukprot:4959687-Pyramimonas_sp.AAC.1
MRASARRDHFYSSACPVPENHAMVSQARPSPSQAELYAWQTGGTKLIPEPLAQRYNITGSRGRPSCPRGSLQL